MPTSATGNSGAGFTLVELMVVITILALASAVVVVSLPDPRGRVRSDAERLAARMLAARDGAISESRDVRVWMTSGASGVERRRRGVWQPLTDKPFEARRWSEGTRALVGGTGRAFVAFDATGLPAAPAVLVLERDRERASVVVAGNGDVRVAP